MAIRQKITPFLWFDANAEEAVDLYVSLFPNSRIVSVLRYGKGDPKMDAPDKPGHDGSGKGR